MQETETLSGYDSTKDGDGRGEENVSLLNMNVDALDKAGYFDDNRAYGDRISLVRELRNSTDESYKLKKASTPVNNTHPVPNFQFASTDRIGKNYRP